MGKKKRKECKQDIAVEVQESRHDAELQPTPETWEQFAIRCCAYAKAMVTTYVEFLGAYEIHKRVLGLDSKLDSAQGQPGFSGRSSVSRTSSPEAMQVAMSSMTGLGFIATNAKHYFSSYISLNSRTAGTAATALVGAAGCYAAYQGYKSFEGKGRDESKEKSGALTLQR